MEIFSINVHSKKIENNELNIPENFVMIGESGFL
jgi:hypothetical protein